MTRLSAPPAHHPAPHRDRVGTAESAFAVLGGPVAWFAQLCANYAFASSPCFVGGARVLSPPPAFTWTGPAILVTMLAAVAVALAALFVAQRLYKATRNETEGDHHHMMETGSGRTRFLALWGVVLSGGFAIVTVINAIAFWMLPRCAG